MTRVTLIHGDVLDRWDGWEESEGTLAEVRLAELREMDIYTFEEFREMMD